MIIKVITPTTTAIPMFPKCFFAKIVAREAEKIFTRLFPINIVIKILTGLFIHKERDLLDFSIKCCIAVGGRDVRAVSEAEKNAERNKKTIKMTSNIPIFYVYYIFENFARRNSYNV